MKKLELNKNNYKINVNIDNNEHFWNSYSENSWEPETFRIFDRFIHPEYAYLDIGAWIGPTVLYGAQKAKKIIAVEPNIDAFNDLKTNINLNPEIKDKIIYKNIAVTSKKGEFKLYTDKNSVNSISSLLSNKKGKDYYTVQGVTFEDLIKEISLDDVSFIKIDIEGGEYSLIPTMKKILQNLDKRPTIYLSLHAPFFFNSPPQNKVLREIEKVRRKLKFQNLTDKIVKSLDFYKYFYDINGNIINDRNTVNSLNECNSIVISDEKW